MTIPASAQRAKSKAGQTNQQGKRAAGNPWVEGLMRLGYVVRGLIYALIGVLAMGTALGVTGKTTDAKGGISIMAQTPAGGPILVLVIVGLSGYALWCLVCALYDPLRRGSGKGQLVRRLGYVGEGIENLAVMLFTVGLLTGRSRGGAGPQSMVTEAFGFPGGRIVVAMAGLVAIGIAVGQFLIAWKASFRRDLKQRQMNEAERNGAMILGRAGYAARGVIYGILGWFVLLAALTLDASHAQNVGGSFAALAQQPLGHWLLGSAALGFVAFGLYSVACARWVRMAVS